MVVGARQSFQFFRQKSWFLGRHRILHNLISTTKLQKNQSLKTNFKLTTRATLKVLIQRPVTPLQTVFKFIKISYKRKMHSQKFPIFFLETAVPGFLQIGKQVSQGKLTSSLQIFFANEYCQLKWIVYVYVKMT